MGIVRRELHKISVLIEADSEELDRVIDAIERLICNVDHGVSPEVKCPYRWFIVSETLSGEEARGWDDVLNG